MTLMFSPAWQSDAGEENGRLASLIVPSGKLAKDKTKGSSNKRDSAQASDNFTYFFASSCLRVNP